MIIGVIVEFIGIILVAGKPSDLISLRTLEDK